MKRKTFRAYEIERDAEGLPTKLTWRGDHPIPERRSEADAERDKLAEHERIYGKREA